MTHRFHLTVALPIILIVSLSAGPLHAELCVPDQVPAATLLIPYFEVDPATCGSPDPRGTTFTVENATPQPHLATIVLNTNLGMPFTSFLVYLPGHASQEIDLARFFCDGYLPSTGSGVSLRGPLAEPNMAFGGCNGTDDPANGPPVYGGDGAVPDYFRNGLISVFSGGPWLDGLCAAADLGNGLLQGYVTVDVSQACSYVLPNEPGYFVSGGNGIATNDNAFLGEYTVELEPPGGAGGWRRIAFPAVSIEAAPAGTFPPDTFPLTTFYGRFLAGLGGDDREPLPTAWQVRHNTESTYTVWRQVPDPAPLRFPCGTWPAPFPLNHTDEVNFDNDANPWIPAPPPIPPPDPPPKRLIEFATQRIEAGPQSYYPDDPPPASFDTGWDFFFLTNTSGSSGWKTGQSWVTVETPDATGVRGHRAIPADTSCFAGMNVTVTPAGAMTQNPDLPLFSDDFESGSTSAWSNVVN